MYWDLIATTGGLQDARTITDTLSEEYMARFGRPLWGAVSRTGFRGLVSLAKLKLTKSKDVTKKGVDKTAQVTTNVVSKVKDGAVKTGDTVSNALSKVTDKVESLTK